MSPSLQDHFAPDDICFGCGAANQHGLRLKSFVDPENSDEVIATHLPAAHHAAYPGVLNGGIIGTLLDCHCNWTAAYHLMRRQGGDTVPVTVTAEYAIKLLKPTPHPAVVELCARPIEVTQRKAVIEAPRN